MTTLQSPAKAAIAAEAWRDNAEHRAAQQRGRTSFYESYRIQVCELVRERAFPL